jgi:hypothetical protein
VAACYQAASGRVPNTYVCAATAGAEVIAPAG